ncbi:MAG: (d)CMP kinase [Clostridia bacterium]|nr:(d)CMP kinase [Clostridia bacterium]
MINIALDGPSGAGKSTLAKALAKTLGYIYTDTGAMYRTIGLAVKRRGIAPDNAAEIEALLPEIRISLKFENGEQKIYLGDEDVGALIRTNEISAYASTVSAIPAVRAHLLDVQRGIARENNVIMDGRDIGTVILPDAQVKFFVTVSDTERARRRHAELVARGESVTLEEVAAAMAERDRKDATREIAPAIPAEDAVFLDNSDALDIVIARAVAIIREKTEGKA